ncbi:hypothetical protein ABIE67_008261 [Streptomyces sp. V4I8]
MRRRSARGDGLKGADVTHVFHAAHLYSRPHIDLQRVAGALCRT